MCTFGHIHSRARGNPSHRDYRPARRSTPPCLTSKLLALRCPRVVLQPLPVVIYLSPPILYLVYTKLYIYIGWVGVGWRPRCETRLSLRELDREGAVFSFWVFAVTTAAVELDRFCPGRTFPPHKGGRRVTWYAYSKTPTRQLHSEAIPVS